MAAFESKPQKHARLPEEHRATEYLANERTFLAWIRTSIAIVGIGFLIARFTDRLHSESPARLQYASLMMGVGMMALGAILAVLAVWRYRVVNRCIDEGRVRADIGLVILATVLIVLLVFGMIVFLLINQ